MRIETASGAEIASLDDWAGLYDTDKLRHHWVVGRSAHSVAEFILNRGGVDHLQRRVSEVLGQATTFERAIPEFEQRFDGYGRGRVHDLGIFGTTATGQSLFVGLEGKVDETFGDLIGDSYLKSKARQIAGESTNAPQRIEALLSQHFSKPDVSMFDLRYQLLYATAGTLAVKAEVSVLFVIVFKTHLYDESIGASNFRDYSDFMSKTGGVPVSMADDCVAAYQLMLGGRKLVCVHEDYELR